MAIITDNIATSSMTHTGAVRTRNEDALLAMPKVGLWAVADGMGGHEAGDYASQCIVGHLYEAGSHFQGPALLEEIPRALDMANREIYQYSQQQANGQIVGSTITVLLMENESFHCFWSGDSRCYLARERQFRALTRDHTEAEELIRQGVMTPEQAENSPESNTLTDAIGIDETPHIDYITDYIYEDDRFLLCTDGLNKVFSDIMLSHMIEHSDIDKVNQQFLVEALNAGAPDNLSSIIVSL